MKGGWIGVDLDGTLAFDLPDYDPGKIGPPVPRMLTLVRRLIREGEDVRIFTARVNPGRVGDRRRAMESALARQAILRWCVKYLGKVIPITHEKDHNMKRIYDDRAVQVVHNTGEIVGNVQR